MEWRVPENSLGGSSALSVFEAWYRATVLSCQRL